MSTVNEAKSKLQQISTAIRQTQQDIDNLDEQRRQITRKIEIMQIMETALLTYEATAQQELAAVTAEVEGMHRTTRKLLDRPQA